MDMERSPGVSQGVGGKVARTHRITEDGVVVLGADPMYLCVDAVDRWCRTYKGRTLRPDRPGSRHVSALAESYCRTEYQVLYLYAWEGAAVSRGDVKDDGPGTRARLARKKGYEYLQTVVGLFCLLPFLLLTAIVQ